MLDYVYKLEFISNFYITFYGSDNIKNDKTSIRFDDNNESIEKILHKLNTNQIIDISYNNETIDSFTEFISSLLVNQFHMKQKNDRLHLCFTNRIIINPCKI